jgi:hypothetical protein
VWWRTRTNCGVRAVSSGAGCRGTRRVRRRDDTAGAAPAVLERAKIHLLDTLGAGLAGIRTTVECQPFALES